MTPEERAALDIRNELGTYGDSKEEIEREIKETNSIPLLKLAKTPLTVICHTGDVNMNPEGTYKIDTALCITQAEWSYGRGKFMPGIETYLKIFDYEPKDILEIKNPTLSHKKIVGLIEMTVGVLRLAKQHGKQIPIFFEEPETHLHPKYHAKCMQFIIDVMTEFGYKLEEIKS